MIKESIHIAPGDRKWQSWVENLYWPQADPRVLLLNSAVTSLELDMT